MICICLQETVSETEMGERFCFCFFSLNGFIF